MWPGSLDVATVGKVDAPSNALNDVNQVIRRIDRQRTGAERDAVGTVVDDVDHPLERSPAGDNPWQTEYRPRRIVRVKCHRNTRASRNGNDTLQKVGKVLPQLVFVHRAICLE